MTEKPSTATSFEPPLTFDDWYTAYRVKASDPLSGDDLYYAWTAGQRAERYAALADRPSVDVEIDKLARFIMEEVAGEPSRSEGAVDTAIRIMRDLLAARTVAPSGESLLRPATVIEVPEEDRRRPIPNKSPKGMS